MTILYNNRVYSVEDYQHVKPGKGAAFMRTTLRNVATDDVINVTLKPSDRMEEAFVEQKDLQYLYNAHDMYYFMDTETFQQMPIAVKHLKDKKLFLIDGCVISGYFYNGKLLTIQIPTFIEMEVTHTLPGVKGDRATAGTKPATLETGLEIQVPLFVENGDRIKIDTRTCSYVERV